MAVNLIKYLALGDSYTIGESVPQEHSFPYILQKEMRERNINIVTPIVIAKTGWTTDELDAAIDIALPTNNFDLVTLLIGVNNQYRKLSEQAYRLEFGALLRRAIYFANDQAKHVIVISIPDWGVTPFAKTADRDAITIGLEIDTFNAINREVAAEMETHYLDITPISRLAAQDNTLLAEDGLHPSGKMYAEWVNLMLPRALEICGA